MYTPPTLQGTLTIPGHMGGSEWHGASFDPMLNVLYVNVNDAPTINRLRPVHDEPGDADRIPSGWDARSTKRHVWLVTARSAGASTA